MSKHKPNYPLPPISSIKSLAQTLSVNKSVLISLSEKIDDSYTSFNIETPSKKRKVHDPKFLLKQIQKRINSRIFENVEYPLYLQGGIKDEENPRDYIRNAEFHCGQKQIISLDIKNFFPSLKTEHVCNIFKYFFKFSEEVSELLTKLVTYKNAVPQGACTSTYIANLAFFNSEYGLVSRLEQKGLTYTRLLDDICISSSSEMTDEDKEQVIGEVSKLFSKFGLRKNPKKTKIEISSNPAHTFEVTGVWAGKNTPQLRKKERRYIRQLVYACESQFADDPTSEKYHKFWHKTSGKVAKMTRLGHKQADDLRKRLGMILPYFSIEHERKLTYETKRLINLPNHKKKRIGFLKKIHKLKSQIYILSRTNKPLADSLLDQLDSQVTVKLKDFWENDYV